MSDKNKTVQEKMTELSQLLEWFQGDDFVLEEATTRFEAASKLAEEIETELMELKNSIKTVAKRFDVES